MNILIASPIHATSAIGRMSVAVAEALHRRGHGVKVVALDEEMPVEAQRHRTDLEVEHWRKLDLTDARAGRAALVVNIGDHYPFHAGVYRLLEEAPAIGIFHDFYLYDLFWGRLVAAHGATDIAASQHDQAICDLYGPETAQLAPQARQGVLEQRRIAADLPMTEWFAARCRGALAHSGFYAPRLLSHCPGPVAVASLPWAGRNVPPLPRRRGSRVVALTVGVLNRNKCAEEVLRAIAASDSLRASVSYELVGPIDADEKLRLTSLAADLGVSNVVFHGPVNDADLEDHLKRADIICCLRKPVLEGASASAIEGMLSGRPVVVADAGFYADLPDDLVFKVAPEVAEDDLRQVLERLTGDEPLRRKTGGRARDWAQLRFAESQYADALLALLADTQQAEAVAQTARRMGAELGALGVSADDAIVDRLDVALRVFGGRGPISPPASGSSASPPAVLNRSRLVSSRDKAAVLKDINHDLPPLDWHDGARRYLAHFFEKFSREQIEAFAFTKPLAAITPEDPLGALGEAVFYLNNFANTIDLLKLPRGARVLDVACGGGWVSHWLTKLGYETVGVDISAQFVELARARLAADPHLSLTPEQTGAAFLEHDLEASPLPGQFRGHFDAAVLESCLHHFLDPIAALAHVVDAMAPEGVVLILEGENRQGPIKAAYMDVMLETQTLERPYSREQLLDVARLAGLPHLVFLGAVNGFFAETDVMSQHMTERLATATREANLCVGARSADALRRIVPSYRPTSG